MHYVLTNAVIRLGKLSGSKVQTRAEPVFLHILFKYWFTATFRTSCQNKVKNSVHCPVSHDRHISRDKARDNSEPHIPSLTNDTWQISV